MLLMINLKTDCSDCDVNTKYFHSGILLSPCGVQITTDPMTSARNYDCLNIRPESVPERDKFPIGISGYEGERRCKVVEKVMMGTKT